MSRISETRPVHVIPADDFEFDPAPPANTVQRSYLLGRQLGLRTETDRAPSGLSEEEQVAFLAGVRDGRKLRHPSDCDLDWDVYDSADEWPYSDETDEVRWSVNG